MRTPATIVAAAALTACTTTSNQDFIVSTQSIAPRTNLTWVGEPTRLIGANDVRLGAKFPEATLTDLKMKSVILKPDGRVKVIITIPSIDTPVCDAQSHLLGETDTLDPRIDRIAISTDLPYAQRRFVEKTGLERLTFLSDYRSGELASATGLAIERNGLFARAVIVVDGEGVVRHLQIVPEITNMPDMKQAFAAANGLLR